MVEPKIYVPALKLDSQDENNQHSFNIDHYFTSEFVSFMEHSLANNVDTVNNALTIQPEITYCREKLLRFDRHLSMTTSIVIGTDTPNEFTINLSEIADRHNCNIATNICISLDTLSTIENISLRLNDIIFDTMGKKLLNVLQYLNYENIGNKHEKIINIPLFFSNNMTPLYFNRKHKWILSIKTGGPEISKLNIIMDVIALGIDTCIDTYECNRKIFEIQKIGTQYTHYYINTFFLQKEHEVILNGTGNVSQILILLEPDNINCVYEMDGIIMKGTHNIGYFNKTINKIHSVLTYDASVYDPHIYTIPFCFSGKYSGRKQTGYLMLDEPIKIKFGIRQKTNFENKHINMHIWCPHYVDYQIINQKFTKVN